MAKSFDETVKAMCRKRISDPDQPLLGDSFSVSQAVAAAVIKRALTGAADAVKLVREILDSGSVSPGEFKVDIRVVD